MRDILWRAVGEVYWRLRHEVRQQLEHHWRLTGGLYLRVKPRLMFRSTEARAWVPPPGNAIEFSAAWCSGMPADLIGALCAHELAHCVQFAHGWPQDEDWADGLANVLGYSMRDLRAFTPPKARRQLTPYERLWKRR